MTELQVTIANLRDVLTGGNQFLFKLETAQKDLEKPKVPDFPPRFVAVKQGNHSRLFMIGLESPANWTRLPEYFEGRGAFTKNEILQIIRGLQVLIGESNE